MNTVLGLTIQSGLGVLERFTQPGVKSVAVLIDVPVTPHVQNAHQIVNGSHLTRPDVDRDDHGKGVSLLVAVAHQCVQSPPGFARTLLAVHQDELCGVVESLLLGGIEYRSPRNVIRCRYG